MRPTTIVFLSSLGAALLFGFIGQAVDVQFLLMLSGLAFLAAIVSGILLLPFMRRLHGPQRMHGLFPRVGKGQRLNPIDGSVERK